MEYRAALRLLVPSMEVEHQRAPAHGTGWRFPLKLPDPHLGAIATATRRPTWSRTTRQLGSSIQ
jgi:hypothetical protein